MYWFSRSLQKQCVQIKFWTCKNYICNKYATLQMTTLNLHIFWNDSIWLQIICLKTCYNRGFTVVHRGSISYSVPEIAHQYPFLVSLKHCSVCHNIPTSKDQYFLLPEALTYRIMLTFTKQLFMLIRITQMRE